MIRHALVVLSFLVAFSAPAFAVEPDEMLSDPALETRARDLSAGLRCLVCRNQNIDESNAELARDLRVLLRERLVAGDSDDEAIAFLVDRYGTYILLKPPFDATTALLWIGPLLMLLAAILGFSRLWRCDRPGPDDPDERSEEDRKLLSDVFKGATER